MATLVLPGNFGLIAAVVGASTVIHHVYMAMGVVKARRQFKIKYPALYADKDNCADQVSRDKFNCVQRAHQNCLENQPAFLAMLITAGVQYPITASILGSIYLVGKVLYFNGYSTGDPEKRMQGAPSYIGLLGLLGICATIGFKSVMALTGSA